MQRITITTGAGKDKTGQPITPAQLATAVPMIRKQFAMAFGGFTESQTMGGWVDDAGQYITEPGFRWVILTDDDTMAAAMALWAGRLLSQHTVVVEYEAEVQVAFMETATVTEAFEAATVTPRTTIH